MTDARRASLFAALLLASGAAFAGDSKAPPPLPEYPKAIPELPAQLPSQLPSQLPAQLPSQLPSQLPPLAPLAPDAPATTSPTSPDSTTAGTTATAPAVMPLSYMPVYEPTSTFEGFVTNDRSYEGATLVLPTPTRAGYASGRGSLTVAGGTHTLSNVRIAGPWTARDVTIWQVVADIYPYYGVRRAGWVWVRIVQKSGSARGAVVDGQCAFWNGRWRLVAGGALASAPIAVPMATTSSPTPTAPNTDDIQNR